MKKDYSLNLRQMIKRKSLVREDTPESLQKADEILYKVERAGGLTAEEVMILTAF
jgi:hypothetical protein